MNITQPTWQEVREDNLPPLGEPVWLWDGEIIWTGGRVPRLRKNWSWASCYGRVWHDGQNWDAELEEDDDYKPTHWMRMPILPNENH